VNQPTTTTTFVVIGDESELNVGEVRLMLLKMQEEYL
jgi:hypothetical protein